MGSRVEIVKGVSGQRIWIYPTEGRPTSTPSVEVKNESGGTETAAATTNVTLDPVDTTLSANASARARSVTLTATTGLEVRKNYLITNTLSQKEWVRVKSINSSSKVVELYEPLEFAHASTSTFQGVGFYREMQDSEVVNLQQLWRLRATYTVGGLSYIKEVDFDIVLTPLHNPLTVAFCKMRLPDVFAQEHDETAGSAYEDFRNVAFERVKGAIRAHGEGWRPALVRTPEDLDEWAFLELKYLLQENGVDVKHGFEDQESALRFIDDKLIAAKNKSLSSLEFMDFDESDSQSADEVRPIRRTFYR